ncbi:hypothetical protein MCOR05_006108 [Pyricularia oryzae]|nr:hypothetical protein MCOR05_006108 [Pyricularia oryzae]
MKQILPYEDQEASSSVARTQQPKHPRVSQACGRCRSNKTKCDEQKPCKNCKERKELCNKEPIKQQDNFQVYLLEKLGTYGSKLEEFTLSLDKWTTSCDLRMSNLDGAIQAFNAYTGGLTRSEETASNGHQEFTFEVLDNDRDFPPSSPVPAGKPAIPENHTTGTGNLLMWPPIQSLVGHLLVKHGIKYPKTYPLAIEENRGPLHLYGRGEGSKKRPGGREVPNDFGLASAYPKDVAPSLSSNSYWGGMDTTETASCLRLDHDHVWKLVGSYMENMQNMHPIILPRDLDSLIQDFLPTVSVTNSARPPPIAGSAAKHETVGEKRKREDKYDGSEPKLAHQRRPALSRDIKTAVVLCILALGEICLHKERIPDIVPTRGEMQGQGFSEPMKRNIDVIPGLQYLANATDILGNQMGGTSVWHVYASILAGLYYGQLGRVMESYWHIYHACVKAQHLLRDHFYRLTAAKGQDIKDTRYHLIYWTCMQLECDIIAELNLQQSGISKYEQSMPHPDLEHMIVFGIDQRVAFSYYGQLWLQKTLNKAHTMLYGPKSERERYTLIDLVKILHSNLTDKEDVWWPKLHAHDPPTPADSILDARLRAKYWGAMNIICRPVIRSILMLNYQGTQEWLDLTDPLNELLDPRDKTVLDIAKSGINALLHSTKAFHGLAERRYIVTNIFGTAQAYTSFRHNSPAAPLLLVRRQLEHQKHRLKIFTRTRLRPRCPHRHLSRRQHRAGLIGVPHGPSHLAWLSRNTRQTRSSRSGRTTAPPNPQRMRLQNTPRATAPPGSI